MSRFSRVATVVAALLLLVAARPAFASPLLTDPVGDAAPDSSACKPIAGSGACPLLPTYSEPAIDLVSADFSSDGTRIYFEITVDDLDSLGTAPVAWAPEDKAYYQISFRTTTASYHFVAGRTFGHTDTGSTVSMASSANGVNFVANLALTSTYDGTTDTISADVAIADLNTALASVCSTCPAIATGTQFIDIFAGAQILKMYGNTGFGTATTYSDGTATHGTYTI